MKHMFVVPPLDDGLSKEERRKRLYAHVDVLVDTEPADPGPVLEQAVVSARVLRDFADGRELAVLSAWEASGVWGADGTTSANVALVGLTGRARKHAGGVRKTAAVCKAVPELHAAAVAGVLPSGHLHQLTQVRKPEVQDLFDREVEVLVKEAKDLNADTLKEHLANWYFGALERLQRNQPDPPPLPPEPADRLFVTPTFEGRAVLDGELGPESTAVVVGAIDAEIDAWRRAGMIEGRPLPELRAAALVEIIRRYGQHGMKDGGLRPSLVAVVDIDTLFNRADVPDDERMARTATIVDGGPVAARTIQRLACDARISLVINDGDSEPLWVGREHRSATPAQRRALLVRSGGRCEWPGCANAHRREAHHIKYWEHFGPTDIDNLVNLCPGHHHLVHERKYRIERTRDGLEFLTPSGRPIRGPTFS